MFEKRDWQGKVDRVRPFAIYVFRRFMDAQCPRMAASLSYSTALAIVPLMAFAFAMFAAFPVFETMRDDLMDTIFEHVLPSMSQDTVRGYIDQFVHNTKGLTVMGLLGLLPSAVLILATIESALNAIFLVTQPRAWRSRVLVFWSLITLGPILLGASFAMSTYIAAMTRGFGVDDIVSSVGVVTTAIPTLLVIVALTVFFLIVPNRRVSPRGAIMGAILSGILFGLLRGAFGVYAVNAAVYDTIYGALSVVPLFLIWLYFSWMVVLLGGVLAAAVTDWLAAKGDPVMGGIGGTRKLEAAMAVLDRLYDASRRGGALERAELLAHTGLGEAAMTLVLDELRGRGFVERTAEDGWVLARDLGSARLFDLFEHLGLALKVGDGRKNSGRWHGRLRERIAELRAAQEKSGAVSLRSIIAEEEDRGAA